MKTLLITLVLFSSSTFAAWEKVISCDGDMLVVDRMPNAEGEFDYQTVFRGKLLDSLREQRLVSDDASEIVRTSSLTAGVLSDSPKVGFQLSSHYSAPGFPSIIFHHRGGMAGNYIFNSCWFKYPVEM